MKHIKTFETYSMNEELFGLPTLKEAKEKIQKWLEEHQNDPKVQSVMLKVQKAFESLPQSVKDKIKSFAKDQTEQKEVVAQVANLTESLVQEGWTLNDVVAGIFGGGLAISGFVMAASSLLQLTPYPVGSKPMGILFMLGLILVMAGVSSLRGTAQHVIFRDDRPKY